MTIDSEDESLLLGENNSLRAGIYGDEELLVALNRCAAEDRNETMNRSQLDELFAGLDYHVVDEQLTNDASLASEIWKLFVVLAGLALLAEAFLCLPPKPETDAAEATMGSAAQRRAAA